MEKFIHDQAQWFFDSFSGVLEPNWNASVIESWSEVKVRRPWREVAEALFSASRSKNWLYKSEFQKNLA